MKEFIRKCRKSIVGYFMTNKLFISYVFFALIGTIVARFFSFGHTFFLKAHCTDLALILLIGLFGYLFKPKSRYKYYLIWLIMFAIMEIINVIYYKFFTSFASFGELATATPTPTAIVAPKHRAAIFVNNLFIKISLTHLYRYYNTAIFIC